VLNSDRSQAIPETRHSTNRSPIGVGRDIRTDHVVHVIRPRLPDSQISIIVNDSRHDIFGGRLAQVNYQNMFLSCSRASAEVITKTLCFWDNVLFGRQ